MNSFLREAYQDKRVLVTGHTGFKGAWLTLWLQQLGCQVIGYGLKPHTTPSLFDLLSLQQHIVHIEGDIRDYGHLKSCFDQHRPDMIFHLAAEAIVLESYSAPKTHFEVNAGGTVNVLEAIRTSQSVKAAVMVTTDKCYDNRHWLWGYRENDALGGHDPYSASKSMAELAIASYRASFFHTENAPQIASARAGNIIGGGDFSAHRILPDTIRALVKGNSIEIRHPASARPWLYVLDALHGYLLLGAALCQPGFAEAWNFGPSENQGITVQQLVEKSIALWGSGTWQMGALAAPKEMALLRLNWDKAAAKLAWKPIYNWESALTETIHWYKIYSQIVNHPSLKVDLHKLCCTQINQLSKGSHEIYQTAHTGSI